MPDHQEVESIVDREQCDQARTRDPRFDGAFFTVRQDDEDLLPPDLSKRARSPCEYLSCA